MSGANGFMASIAHDFVGGLARMNEAEAISLRHGFLQRLDPRAKLVALLLLVIAASLGSRLLVLLALFLGACVLALVSSVTLGFLARRVWLTVAVFSGLLALPALVMVPGQVLWHLPWIGWNITMQGLRSAAFLIGRGEVCASLVLLMVMTTPWNHVLKAMRSLGMPLVVVAVLGMTQRYIVLLVQLTMQMFEARRSRVMVAMGPRQQRHLVFAMVGVLVGRSLQLSGEVHQAMVARGYRGEIRLIHEFRFRLRDGLVMLVSLAVCLLVACYR